ncbi:hypothetical protein DPEC_G00015710 [Dallia pectoralis]|uniref:Uncharacterized protein n=1 Tax=Dallia pectoralis TaxID=75939 RepID=A0ACC2HMW2_DALPE|nr:hypothetical protein DPEC_G00015710 [Dallia pectoralis]
MATLSIKSDQEIKELLDEYGIKHGPIVDSTRPLYEKKLKEAMSKDKKMARPSTGNTTKPSADKTFYREEQEEVTYVTYRTPVKSEGHIGDGKPYMRSRQDFSDQDFVDNQPYSKSRPQYSGVRDYVDEPRVYSTPSASYSSYSKPLSDRNHPAVSGVKESQASSGRLIPLWIQFLVFLGVAAVIYFVFTNMESAEENPFNRIQ